MGVPVKTRARMARSRIASCPNHVCGLHVNAKSEVRPLAGLRAFIAFAQISPHHGDSETDDSHRPRSHLTGIVVPAYGASDQNGWPEPRGEESC